MGAQEADSAGVGISLSDLSDYPTHLTVDGFMVDLTNLTATEEYQVTVSSDSAGLGIGGCGTALQTETVTGVAARELRFLVYACAVGEATVTAEVRRTGASSPEASISQRLTVEAIPENAIGARGQRVRAPAAGAVPKVGTPGSVPNAYFSHKYLTSVRANWGIPSDGGTPLTGFGVLFWQAGNPDHPGYANPLVLGSDVRSRNFPNLQPGTTYNFQIHACNGPDSCGIWTVPIVEVTTLPTATPTPTPTPTAGPDPVVAATPGPVRDLEITGVGDGKLTVDWEAPNNVGVPPVTRYRLHRAQHSSDTWTSVPDIAAATTHASVSGLTNGTKYDVRVQACSGDAGDDCGAWVAPVCGVPGTNTTPENVVIASVASGIRSLNVTWEAPDCVSKLTHYAVQTTEDSTAPSGPTWLPDDDAKNVVGQTFTRLDLLDVGTTYLVRLRACNASNCSSWSTAESGTPSGTPLPAPQNLDVKPLPQRRALLTWSTIVNATHYVVEVQLPGSSQWAPPDRGIPTSGTVTRPDPASPIPTEYEIDLDAVVSLGKAKRGLADESHFRFQVKARSPNFAESPASETVIIIDTPIVRANGDNRDANRMARDGKVVVTWKPIEQVISRFPAGGSYRPRYRRSDGDHSSLSWTLSDFRAYQTDNVTVDATEATIRQLLLEQVYGIQLNYDSDGSGPGPIDVFSARDAYVWPSRTSPADGDRVANMPAVNRLNDSTYTYRICTDTFAAIGETRKDEWVHLIDHAFDRWEEMLAGLVTITRLDKTANPCVSYDELASQWTEIIRERWAEVKAEVRLMYPHYNDDQISDQVRPIVTAYIDQIVAFMLPVRPIDNPDHWRELFEFRTRIGHTIAADKVINEIKLFDDTQGDIKYFIDRVVFSNLAESLRQGCWLNERDSIEDSDVLMCTESNWWIVPPLERIWSSDILIRHSKFMDEELDVATEESRMNKCGGNSGDDDNSAYASFIHEIGHVLGVGHGREGDKFERGHPARDVVDSVMTYETVPKCAPYPLDLMLINALYQTKE